MVEMLEWMYRLMNKTDTGNLAAAPIHTTHVHQARLHRKLRQLSKRGSLWQYWFLPMSRVEYLAHFAKTKNIRNRTLNDEEGKRKPMSNAKEENEPT